MSGPPPKKLRATHDLTAPTPVNYIDIWKPSSVDAASLKTAGTLFGVKRSWFVRESYVALYSDIMDDNERHTQIVNGTAGIGKSSFLLYLLARLRCDGKCAMLHYQRTESEIGVAMFFPADGSAPDSRSMNDPDYQHKFMEWYALVGSDESVFLVDGVVSFTLQDVDGVKYVAAKSPSCSIGWMSKVQSKRQRWLRAWAQPELVSYANSVGIEEAEEIIADNYVHLGGVCRYALMRNAARDAALDAISEVGAKELYKLVTTGLETKYEQQKLVDRLVLRHPPEGNIGLFGRTFTFASEFVATRVAMALCLETQISTADLLLTLTLQGVPAAGSMRGVIFEAYAARKISEGGTFHVKQIGSKNETTLQLPVTTVMQKDTKTLNRTNYPPDDIKDKLVWPNPAYNMPAIDMFMLLMSLQTCTALQMTVARSHGLDCKGTKAFLKYFDSVLRALKITCPGTYALYFAVPPDIYDQFSNTQQPITGPHGAALDTQEAADIQKRITQWVLKVE
eukprot:scaffold277451_cov45-Attheya_sp.AAC.1